MSNIDEEFLLSIYDEELKKKIISVALENIPDDEKIKRLVIYLKEAKG